MITIVYGDITQATTDAIVNAANTSLLGGGGVDGCIHAAAGWELMAECLSIPCIKGTRCKIGEAVITSGYNLKAKHVIHTVGPRHPSKNCDKYLASAYRGCLTLAEKHNLKSIAFPAISTGVYRYPMGEATEIAKNVCEEFPSIDIRLYFYKPSFSLKALISSSSL